MKLHALRKYISYFFYIASNWNMRIGAHLIGHEVKGEKKYGIDTTGADELQSLDNRGIDISHATIYMPVSYDILESVFDHINISSFAHMLDIGCGKGRSLCVAAYMGVKEISGVELSKNFCADAKENLEHIKTMQPNFSYRIFNNDAFYFEIDESIDCIFMFNPFDDVIMEGVMQNIDQSLENRRRKMTVIYVNPLCKHVLYDHGYKQSFHLQKMKYLEVSVFTK